MDLTSRLPWGREFWIVGPDYYLPRAEFEYVQRFLTELGALRGKSSVQAPKEGSWRLETKSHQVVITRTSADVRKLASRAVDGILMVEAGQQSYLTFLKCIGRISQPRGFLLASGTFEDSGDWYSTTFREWMEDPDSADGQAFSLPAWDNPYVFPLGREDPEIKNLEKMYAPIPGYFMEKVGAVPAPPLGVIFRAFSYLHHVSEAAVYDPRLPVYLGIDPAAGGPSAYAIVACQFVPLEGNPQDDSVDRIDLCKVIDGIYLIGGQFETVAPLVSKKIWFPNVKGGAIDCEAPDERKRWLRFFGIPLAAKKVPVLAGERRLHSFLSLEGGMPRLLFHPSFPAEALREFSQYRAPVQTVEEMATRPSSTVKNRRGPDHMLKALWYLLYARYGPVKGTELPRPFIRRAWSSLRDALRGSGW